MLRLSASHEDRYREHLVGAGPVTIGSSEACDFVLPFPGISRRHALVEPAQGAVRVLDLDSKNGIRVKARATKEAVLRPGESVRLGRALLTLEYVDTSDALAVRPLPRRPAPERPDASTANDTADEVTGAAAALALISRVERSRIDLWSTEGRRVLEGTRAVLGADCIFLASMVEGEPVVRLTVGVLPELSWLGSAMQSRSDGASFVAIEGTLRFVVASATPGDEEQQTVLAAAPVTGDAREWAAPLLHYLASRFDPASSRRVALRAPRIGPALALPDAFVPGSSAAATLLVKALEVATRSALDVLILGETGVGKEYVARIVHESGSTARGPFVAINCAAIPSEMLEAELFGVKGRVATGVDPRPGLLTRARHGTIFLDEIGDMPEPLQAKLLRVLQEREVLPIGGHEPEPIEVRVVSSTNKDLRALVETGRFRADLYHRLRGLEIVVPPLRERRDDIGALALVFADRASAAQGRQAMGISRRALRRLTEYAWPGNVRELRNEIERAVLLCQDGKLISESCFAGLHVPTPPAKTDGAADEPTPAQRPATVGFLPLADRVIEVERKAIVEALTLTEGNKAKAARLLRISRNGLSKKLHQLGLTSP